MCVPIFSVASIKIAINAFIDLGLPKIPGLGWRQKCKSLLGQSPREATTNQSSITFLAGTRITCGLQPSCHCFHWWFGIQTFGCSKSKRTSCYLNRRNECTTRLGDFAKHTDFNLQEYTFPILIERMYEQVNILLATVSANSGRCRYSKRLQARTKRSWQWTRTAQIFVALGVECWGHSQNWDGKIGKQTRIWHDMSLGNKGCAIL